MYTYVLNNIYIYIYIYVCMCICIGELSDDLPARFVSAH